MPKCNDFDLDLQNETDLQLYAENPTRQTIVDPGNDIASSHCTDTKYTDCIAQ